MQKVEKVEREEEGLRFVAIFMFKHSPSEFPLPDFVANVTKKIKKN